MISTWFTKYPTSKTAHQKQLANNVLAMFLPTLNVFSSFNQLNVQLIRLDGVVSAKMVCRD
jgi:hypothetical protein